MRLMTNRSLLVAVIVGAAIAVGILSWQLWPSDISSVEAVTRVQNACTHQNTSLNFEGTTTILVGNNPLIRYDTKAWMQDWNQHRIDRVQGTNLQYELIDLWGGNSYQRQTDENGNWGEWIESPPLFSEAEFAEALKNALDDPELSAEIKAMAEAEATAIAENPSAEGLWFCGLSELADVKYEGEEDLEGTNTKKFVAYVSLKDLIDLTGGENYDRTTYWIDDDGKLLKWQYEAVRAALNSQPNQETTIVGKFSGFGEHNEITAPDLN